VGLLGGPFSQDFIDTVRGAGDIVQVISDYVPLKRAGVRYKGLCPFHQEKTPSFSVDPNNQLFYCFGCQTGGDVFKFVMLYEKASFGESVELLAKRFGVQIPVRRQSPEDDARERLLQLDQAAAMFYRSLLKDEQSGARVRDYLDKRGLDSATCERLVLGYAPDSWEAVQQHLQAKGFRAEEVARAGLALPRKSGRGHYDRFRDRLIFPIRDLGGRTVAFGGRTLGDAEPKYINSPETPTYVKGNHLYGLDLAREAVRREGFAVVVEGYLDLAALVQAGFENVVASLGTAFTPTQARLLSRFTERIVISYDGDTAGAAATARSLDMLLQSGFEVRVVDLPGDADPDDYIRQHGAEAFGKLLREAPAYLDFLLRRELRARDVSRMQEKIAAVNAVLPHIAKLDNSIERASWATRLADTLQIEDGLVLQELRTALKSAQTTIRQRPRRPRTPLEAEARLVSLLLRSEEERLRWVDEIDREDLAGTQVGAIVETILRLTREGRPVDGPLVLSALQDEHDHELFTRIAFREDPESGPGIEDCLCALRRDRLQREGKQRVREIVELQDKPDSSADAADVNERLKQLQQLAKQRDALY
jgi:DNA primase